MNEETKPKFNAGIFLKPDRLPDESYNDYVARRKLGNKFLSIIKKGNLIWDSSKARTYRKPKDSGSFFKIEVTK